MYRSNTDRKADLLKHSTPSVQSAEILKFVSVQQNGYDLRYAAVHSQADSIHVELFA